MSSSFALKKVLAVFFAAAGVTAGATTISSDTTYGLSDIEAISEPISIAADATLTFNLAAGEVGTVSQVISGAGKVAMTGGGGLILTAANTFTGGFTMKAVSTVKTSGKLGVGAAYASGRNLSAFGTGTITMDGFMGEVRLSAVGDWANAFDFKQVGQIRFFDANETTATGEIRLTGAVTGVCDIILNGAAISSQTFTWTNTITTTAGHDVILCPRGGSFNANGTVVARALRCTANSYPDYWTYNQLGWPGGGSVSLNASNDVEVVSATGASFYLVHPDAVPPTAALTDNYRRVDPYRSSGYIVFRTDATIGSMPLSHPEKMDSGTISSANGQWSPGLASRTVTVVGGGDYLSHVQLKDASPYKLSFHWNPSDDAARIVLTNRAHTMSGTFTVSKGEVIVRGPSASLANVPTLAVKAGAKFSLSTEVASPLAALKKLVVASTGLVTLPAGTELTVDALIVDGFPHFAGETFDSATTPWLAGDNVRITVSANAVADKTTIEALPGPVTIPDGCTMVIRAEAGENVVCSQPILGDGEVRLVGAGDVTFTAANEYTGGLTVDTSTSVRTNRVTITNVKGFGTGPVTVNTKTWLFLSAPGTDVTYANDFAFNDHGFIYPQAAESGATRTLSGDITATTDFFLAYGYNSKGTAGVTFNLTGSISAPGQHVIITGGNNTGWWHFYGEITAHALRSACGFFDYSCSDTELYSSSPSYSHGWGKGNFHLYAENEIELVGLAGAALYLHHVDALPSTVEIKSNAYRNDPSHGGTTVYLDYLDVTVEKITCDVRKYAMSDGISVFTPGSNGGSLTVTGGDSYATDAQFRDRMNFNWNPPTDDATLILSNQSHTIQGTFTVSKGTVWAAGAVSFVNLPKLVVKAGATFRLETTKANALRSVKSIELGDGAVLEIVSGATPFTAGLVNLALGDGAKVKLGSGVVASFGHVSVNGAYLTDEKTYTSENCNWIEGAGSAPVSSASAKTIPWKAAASGTWKTGSNWLGDAVPAVSKIADLTIPGGDYTATVDADAGSVSAVRVGNGGTGTANLSVAAPLVLSGAEKGITEIGAGGKVTVAEGGTLTLAPNAVNFTAGDRRFAVEDGGELAVTGGTLALTNVTGVMTVGRDSTLSASAGSVLVRSAGGFLKVLSSGEVALSGTAEMGLSQGGGSSTLLSLDPDASFKASGNAVVYPMDGIYSSRNRFELAAPMEFTDSSRFGRTAAPVGAEPGWGYAFMPPSGAVTGVLSFADHAAFQDWSYSTKLESSDGGAMRMILSSDAEHYVYSSLYLGSGVGRGELLMTDGRLLININGLYVPGPYERQTAKAALKSSGELEMTGGTITLKCQDDDNKVFKGLLVGNASIVVTNAAGQAYGDAMTGVIKLSGKAVIDNYSGSSVIIGIGSPNASGRIIQMGGAFTNRVTASVSPTVIGMGGATGEWVMVDGTTSIAGDLYVGGLTLAQLGRTVPIHSKGTATQSARIYYGDNYPNQARGTLTVYGGGRFSVGGDLTLSADGVGTLCLAPGGRLDVAGALDARAGSKLVVDLTTWNGRFCRLATFGSTTTAFADANITIVGEPSEKRFVRISETDISVSGDRGLILFVR